MKDFDRLRELLDQEYVWPTIYTFKFVMKSDQIDLFKNLVVVEICSTKESSGGKYTSITAQKLIMHSEQVIEVYKSASSIPGIISL